MKNYLTIIIGSVFIIFICCTAQKKVGYDFPEQMLPHVKVDYEKLCDRGQTLYNINCAGCHNSKVKGKKIIPDFKPEQLVGYTLRITNARHESALTDTLVTTEELGLIMTFLTYKQKSGVPMSSKK